jgi:hypothetical protein
MSSAHPTVRTLYLSDAVPEEARMPTAVFRGELDLGGTMVGCYVLDDARRIISSRSSVMSLTGKDHGNLGKMMGAASLKPLLDGGLDLGKNVEFSIAGTQFTGRGITAETYLRICKTFASGFVSGALRTTAQRRVGLRCSAIVAGCAEVGLVALIDEATGFQAHRDEYELRERMSVHVRDTLRPWEKTFPDEFWTQLARLTGWTGSIHSRPKWWGKIVMEVVYNAMDPEVAAYLRTTKPPPRHGQNYYQWLTLDVGLRALHAHINQVIGIALSCHDFRELQDKVAHRFGSREVTASLFWPQIAVAPARGQALRDAA